MSIVYFAHSYREKDARVVDFFGRLMRSEGLTPSLDPPSDAVNSCKLQRHLNASDGMVAVLSARDDGVSPHILFEISLCLQSRKPLIVFVEDTVPSALSDRVLQRRFSRRSFLRQVREHRHAMRVFGTYLPQVPIPDYQPSISRRSCVLLGFDTLRSSTIEALSGLLNDELLYTPTVVSATDAGTHHWNLADTVLAADIVLTCLEGPTGRNSYLAGVAAGARVPAITVATHPDFTYPPWPPKEYQPRWINSDSPAEDWAALVTSELALFEEDFLDLADQEEVERYADLLLDLHGSYDEHTRREAMEVVMGDKYVTGQAGAVGPSASAQDMTFNQVWNQAEGDVDLNQLASELARLRQELRSKAVEPKQDVDVAAIAEAEVAATKGNGPEAMRHLSKVGSWALAAATSIGTAVAAAAIKAATGI